MQFHHLKSAAFKWLGVFIAGITLFSFVSPSGGDRYEVYLNKKLIFQEFVHSGNAVKSFQLERNNSSAEIDIVYNHCGQPGKNRVVKVTDAENHVLKQWNFGNGKDPNAQMNFQVKDLPLADKNNAAGKLHIYYASEQLPKGKHLATIILVDNNSRP